MKCSFLIFCALFLLGCSTPITPAPSPASEPRTNLDEVANQQFQERADRAREYASKHPDASDDLLKSFVAGTVEVGMTPEQVEVIKGAPTSVSKSDGVGGKIETLFYSYGSAGGRSFFFLNNKLARWSEY